MSDIDLTFFCFSVFHLTARKLPKNPIVPERDTFPIVPPKNKDKKGCC